MLRAGDLKPRTFDTPAPNCGQGSITKAIAAATRNQAISSILWHGGLTDSVSTAFEDPSSAGLIVPATQSHLPSPLNLQVVKKALNWGFLAQGCET